MKAFEQPKFRLEPVESTDTHAVFSVAPLERGFGVTIGNSLRRVLLSSLPGLAVYAIEVEGAMHEYTALPGVLEDLISIVLNIKQIILKDTLENDEEVYKLILDVNARDVDGKEKVVTAGDIVTPSNVSVVNSDLVLCHVAQGGHIHITMHARTGRGFTPAEGNKSSNMSIGVIPIDSSFTPILNVKTSVDSCRVGQDSSYEKLILDVTTNGSTTPTNAVALASKILEEHFKVFEELDTTVEEKAIMKESVDQASPKFVSVTLEDLDLSVRSFNCLKRSGIFTIEALCAKTQTELLRLRNLGKKSYNEIIEKLEKANLKLKQSDKAEVEAALADMEE